MHTDAKHRLVKRIVTSCSIAVVLAIAGAMCLPKVRGVILGRAPGTDIESADRSPFRIDDEAITLTKDEAAAADVQTTTAEATEEPFTISLTGRTGLNQETVAHVHAQFPGRIVEVGPQLGSTVEGPESPGGATRLCLIESNDLAAAKSDYLKAKVQLELDQDYVKRAEPLARANVVSDKALLDAQSAVRKSAADLDAARQKLLVFGLTDAELADVEHQQGRQRMLYEIRAPRSGVITEKNVTSGEVADQATNLFTIADPTTLWVWGDVYERDLPKVRVGQTIEVSVSADQGRAAGRRCTVEWISPVLDPTTRSVRIRGTLPNADHALLADMYARLVLTIGDGRGSIVLPADSIVTDVRGARFVLVQEGPNEGDLRIRRRTVEAEPLDGARFRVLSGVNQGDQIVCRGALGLFAEVNSHRIGAESQAPAE
jgi:cobalt-zinc-cadmium efflux system membrane fusion protein